MNYFVEDVLPAWWDGRIHECTIPDRIDWRELTKPLPCGDGWVEVGHESDGSTVKFMRHVPFLGFPKHKHPIASRRHDKRCEIIEQYKKTDPALYKRLRKMADLMFKRDIKLGTTQWKDIKDKGFKEKVLGCIDIARTWWEQQKGYAGVRVGAFF